MHTPSFADVIAASQRQFDLDLVELDNLKTKTVEGKRHYNTPGGLYPSVTTVLSNYNKEGILEWRKRVGEEEANKVMVQASRRGTAVHEMCENYILNTPEKVTDPVPSNIESFRQIKTFLDQHVGVVKGVETPLYSDYLKVAGRCDCIAEYDGKMSIIDFKTSRKFKKKEWIKSYFMQTAGYAVMFEERTGIPVSQLVILMAVDGDQPLVFVEKRDDHIHDLIEVINEHSSHSN